MSGLGREEASAGGGRMGRVAVTLAALVVLGAALLVIPLGVILGPPDWRTVEIQLKYWPRDERPAPEPPAPAPDQPAQPFAAASAPTAPGPGSVGADEPAPRALEDTAVDGDLAIGPDGHFQPTAAAIRLFRYFMTANGEWRRERVRGAIQAEIERRLTPPASAEARAFLDQYFRYLDASRSLDPAGLDARDLAGRLEQVRDLQRAIFGDGLAEKLFGPENDQAEAALDRLVHRLAPEHADGATSRGAPDLPAATQAAREHATAPSDAARRIDELRRDGADPRDVRAERVHRFGEEAADRLENLDHQRDEWDARLDAYRAVRDRILANPALDAAQRVDALDRLREERFSGDEIRHVAELDRLDALFPTLPPR